MPVLLTNQLHNLCIVIIISKAKEIHLKLSIFYVDGEKSCNGEYYGGWVFGGDLGMRKNL